MLDYICCCFSLFYSLQPLVACRNFNWVKKAPSSKRKNKRRLVAEPVVRARDEPDVVNANQYVTHMLAVSLGVKLFDAMRRILVYTKANHPDKSFYAACRGLFPIQELCGTMTALALAKRDLLGVDTPLWKLLAPAVVIHALATFRGMKVIYIAGCVSISVACIVLFANPRCLVFLSYLSQSSSGTRRRLGQRCSFCLYTKRIRSPLPNY